MKIYRFLAPAALLLVAVACRQPLMIRFHPGGPSAVTAPEIRAHLQFLADGARKGRFPGTPQAREVRQYIIQNFRWAGIQPGIGDSSYFQPFPFIDSLFIGPKTTLEWQNKRYLPNQDFVPLYLTGDGQVEAPVVFVGYGMSNEDSSQPGDYTGVDVKGKWVLVLRGIPEGDTIHVNINERGKVRLARDNGAAGVVFLDPGTDELPVFQRHRGYAPEEIPVIQIKRSVGIQWLAAAGLKLEDVSVANSGPVGRLIPGELKAIVDIIRHEATIGNVVGKIPGSDPRYAGQWVVIGAHRDHLGLGGEGSGSMAPQTKAVHNGADDNASGVAAVLEVGEYLAAHRDRLKRGIILVAFDAEEQGDLGSRWFVDHPPVPRDSIACMINLDMVGRLRQNQLIISGTGTASVFPELLKAAVAPDSLETIFNPSGLGPSDHASFYAEKIPVLFFFTGSHKDYHRPSDDWPKCNPAGEVRVVQYLARVVKRLAALPEKPKFIPTPMKRRGHGNRRFKVSLGVIPAYTSPVKGMLLEGVVDGKPAAKAGLQKGDVIVGINGKTVNNIYDYVDRLGELRPGQKVRVKIIRDKQEMTITLQL